MKLLTKIPRKINLAFSGGVDSLAAAKFLSNNHDVTLLHFNHGCEYSNTIEDGCRDLAKQLQLPIIVGKIGESHTTGSLEDFWRRNRYRFLRSFENHFITVHHLDDALSEFLFRMLHGEDKIIPIMDDKVLRPFLIVKKEELVAYAKQHGLEPVHDPYNFDLNGARNYIHEFIVPHALKINPGMYKTIRKKYLRMIENGLVDIQTFDGQDQTEV